MRKLVFKSTLRLSVFLVWGVSAYAGHPKITLPSTTYKPSHGGYSVPQSEIKSKRRWPTLREIGNDSTSESALTRPIHGGYPHHDYKFLKVQAFEKGNFALAKVYAKQQFKSKAFKSFDEVQSRLQYRSRLHQDDTHFYQYKWAPTAHLESYQKFGLDTLFSGRSGYGMGAWDAGRSCMAARPSGGYNHFAHRGCETSMLLLIRLPKDGIKSLNFCAIDESETFLAGTELSHESVYVWNDSRTKVEVAAEHCEEAESHQIRTVMDPPWTIGWGDNSVSFKNCRFVPVRMMRHKSEVGRE